MAAPIESQQQQENAQSLENKVANMDLNASQQTGEQPEIDADTVLPLEPLYKLCMKYYKDNIGNALAISYQEKTRLLALHKQVTSGKYKPETGQAPGFLDVVGNDRKQAWQALGEMTKENAMKEFIRVLHKCSPSVKPYVIAYRVQLQEEAIAKQRQQEEEKKRADEADALRQAEAARQQQGDGSQQLQEQQVRQALNQQTEAQFRSYAQSQYPSDITQQNALIKQLQDQHFQQYVRQVYEQQMRQQQGASQQPPAQASTQPATSLSDIAGAAAAPSVSASAAATLPGATHNEQINGVSESASLQDVVIQEASMWTQKDVIAFKNAIKKESKVENHTDCIIKVGSGETVTIRVPTHENGNCLFWEFATDHYDIAFGVYFEWNSSPDDNVQVHISDSSDDEDDETNPDDKSDAEKGGDGVRKPHGPPTDEIIPIYRRDSHEEVYCGSHIYPGRGVYLLKFDNSYSLWRSKTLYYRVYYSR